MEKPSAEWRRAFFSDCGKFVVFKLKAGAHVDVIGQKRQSNLGFYAGVIILYKCVVTENIDHSAEHKASYENRPRVTGGGIWF